MTTNLIDVASGNALALPGQTAAANALLTQILIELRVMNQYLFILVSGQETSDEPFQLRTDEIIDPAVFKTT